jgi:anti-sigma factor NepR-like protein
MNREQFPPILETALHDFDSDEARTRLSPLGKRLRRLYDGVLNEPLPPDFAELLERIDGLDTDPERPLDLLNRAIARDTAARELLF